MLVRTLLLLGQFLRLTAPLLTRYITILTMLRAEYNLGWRRYKSRLSTRRDALQADFRHVG